MNLQSSDDSKFQAAADMDAESALVTTSELKLRLYHGDKSLKRRRQAGAGYVLLAALFMILQGYYHGQNVAQAWGHSRIDQVVYIAVILGMFLTCVASIYLYMILATGMLGEWLSLSLIDRQIKTEDELIESLCQVSSQACERRRDRLEAELSSYNSRNDVFKLAIATASGLLIGSLAIAKDGNFTLTIWATFILSVLFFANAYFAFNRQTLRRLCWVLSKAGEAAKREEALQSTHLP